MNSTTPLTSRQTEILEYLRNFHSDEGYAPTHREIAVHFGFKSPKAAADHLKALEKKGYVRCHVGRSRGIVLLPEETTPQTITSVPIIGCIQAGYPDTQTEHSLGTLAIDKQMICGAEGHRLFALKVNGESMKGRGIHDGDWVVADADASAQEGNMVVALMDGNNTLKTLSRRKGQLFLKAENKNYPDCIPINEMVIQGVVKAVLRQI